MSNSVTITPWDEETITQFMEKPLKYINGYSGIREYDVSDQAIQRILNVHLNAALQGKTTVTPPPPPSNEPSATGSKGTTATKATAAAPQTRIHSVPGSECAHPGCRHQEKDINNRYKCVNCGLRLHPSVLGCSTPHEEDDSKIVCLMNEGCNKKVSGKK